MWWITAGCLLVKGICRHLKVTQALMDIWQASETSHNKSSPGNFQHQYLPKLLVNVNSYCLMVKSVSSCYDHGRWLFSNLVTYKSNLLRLCYNILIQLVLRGSVTKYRAVGSNFIVVRPTNCKAICIMNSGWQVVINASNCAKHNHHTQHANVRGSGSMPPAKICEKDRTFSILPSSFFILGIMIQR